MQLPKKTLGKQRYILQNICQQNVDTGLTGHCQQNVVHHLVDHPVCLSILSWFLTQLLTTNPDLTDPEPGDGPVDDLEGTPAAAGPAGNGGRISTAPGGHRDVSGMYADILDILGPF